MNLVYLEKYTPLAKGLICDAQLLADAMRHEMTCIVHLCIVIRNTILADNLIQKIGAKNKPIIPVSMAKEFLKLTSEDVERKLLSSIPKATTPNCAYLSNKVCQLMSFAQDNEKVNVKVLMSELLLMLRNNV